MIQLLEGRGANLATATEKVVDHGLTHKILNRALEEILVEETYRTVYPQEWAEQANPVSVRNCSKKDCSRRGSL